MSACIFSAGYQQKGATYVYSNGYTEHPIADVDAATFQILGRYGYAKDALHVYYHENAIQGADSGSFIDMTESYGKDNTRVYYEGKIIPGASPSSFTLFGTSWGKDSQDIYFQYIPMEACDPASFILLDKYWERDDQCFYRWEYKVPGADPSSFVILSNEFAKDRNHAYYGSGFSTPKIIEDADVATFNIFDGMCKLCAEDKNGCYRFDERVDCQLLK
jgi:hypothetical protein